MATSAVAGSELQADRYVYLAPTDLEGCVSMPSTAYLQLQRRELLLGGAACAMSAGIAGTIEAAPLKETAAWSGPAGALVPVTLEVNGSSHHLNIDTRTTLLDALREHLDLTGTKKGCDHGQCGSCTVIVDGRRINACLSLAIMHDGDEITTIEGLGTSNALHPMQAAFVKHDGYQCGYCTPGQICSAVAALAEISAGMPSHVTADLTESAKVTADEIRERMSGNICRCGAYSNIVEAIIEVAGEAE